MVQDQIHEVNSVDTTPSKLKRSATEEPEDSAQVKSVKVHTNGQSEPSENVADGAIEITLVDSQTGLSVEVSSLTGLEIVKFIDDEITKLQYKDSSAVPSHNLIQLGTALGEDDRCALINIFELSLEKFKTESIQDISSLCTPEWWASWVSLHVRFGQIMNLDDYIETAKKIVINASTSLDPSAPLPFLMFSTVNLLQAAFLVKSHLDKEFPLSISDAPEAQNTFTLPAVVLDTFKEAKVLTQKFVNGNKTSGDPIPFSAFNDWLQALYTLATVHPELSRDVQFLDQVLSLASNFLPQILDLSPELKTYLYNNIQSIYAFYDALGNAFPEHIKSILTPVESGFETFITSKEATSTDYSNWGRVCLALSKLTELHPDEKNDEETHIENVAKYFEQGIDSLERALELNPNDSNLKSYLNELHSASGLVPGSDAHPGYPGANEDEEEDPDFDPADAGESSSDNSLSDFDEEDIDDDDEDEEEEPLENVPEVTLEPGQELVTGTRLSTLNSPPALAEDEDETVDPDFVPQVSDVEKDFEDETLVEDAADEEHGSDPELSLDAESGAILDVSQTFPTKLLTKDTPLEDEPEEVDPDFVPVVAHVEEDLASSEAEEVAPISTIQQLEAASDEDEDDDNASFAPLASSSDNEDDLTDASE